MPVVQDVAQVDADRAGQGRREQGVAGLLAAAAPAERLAGRLHRKWCRWRCRNTPTTASVQRCRDQKKILPSLYTESLKNEFTQRLAGFKTSQSTPVIAAAASPLTSKRLTMVSPMATPQKTALTIRSIGWGVNSVPHTGHGAANRLAKDRLNVDGNRLPQAGHFLAVIEFPPL
mgnify:CR=1 FL=1